MNFYINTITDEKKSQSGSVIIYTVLIMIAVMVISLSLMRILLPKLKVTGESISSVVALYGADSGLELCIFTNRVDTSAMTSPPTLSTLLTNFTIAGVNIQSYPNPCPFNGAVGFRTVGTYRGISRSLEVY